MLQAIQPPQPWPTTAALDSPSDRMTLATSALEVRVSYPRGGLSEAP